MLERLLLAIAGLALSGCIGQAMGECDAQERELDSGEAVGGVSPDGVVDPLLGTHRGTLTWLLADRQTELGVEVSRTGPAREDVMDCPSSVTRRLEVPLVVRVSSADDLVSHEQEFWVEVAAGGRLERLPPIRPYVPYTTLYDAGVTNPNTLSGPNIDLEIVLDATTLAPADTTVDVVRSRDQRDTIGTIEFD